MIMSETRAFTVTEVVFMQEDEKGVTVTRHLYFKSAVQSIIPQVVLDQLIAQYVDDQEKLHSVIVFLAESIPKAANRSCTRPVEDL